MRRLIVCADGTWNKDEEDEEGGGLTNVTHIAKNVRRENTAVQQEVFYDRGVGSGKGLDKWFGGAFGSGISSNIRDDCYGFLVQHFSPGDELFLFGFSRGAYTVRSLAGMVRKCGIIRRTEGRQPGDPLDERERKAIDRAYDFYRDRDPKTHPRKEVATEFRRTHSHETPIKFLGVWDTVGSLGIPTRGPIGMISKRRHSFHDVQLSSHVQHAFQALAIDERRRNFEPAIWEVADADPARAAASWTVEQRWFAGAHSNVGGGYPDRGLSNCALKWLAGKAERLGLEFVDGFVDSIAADCMGIRREPLTGIYRFLGTFQREIEIPRKDKDGNVLLTFEVVDDSVPARCCATELRGLDREGYRPKNFLKYWERDPGRWPGREMPKG